MKRITTVNGDISLNELGLTSMHEHTLFDLSTMTDRIRAMLPQAPPEKATLKIENLAFLKNGGAILSEECSKTDDIEYLINELRIFKSVGGKSICDCSPIGMRGNPDDIKKISEASGINIICATGLYTYASRPNELMEKSENYLISLFEKEISEGMNGTMVKPGFIKCALGGVTEKNTIDENEITALRACSSVAEKTGMSIHVHTAAPLTSEHILYATDIILDQCGVEPDRLLMCHMDAFLLSNLTLSDYVLNEGMLRNINMDLPLKLLDKGVNIGIDSWGIPLGNPNIVLQDDYDRLKELVYLLKRGYESQIVLGHDVVGELSGVAYGSYGFTRFPEFTLPMLKQFGFGDEVINKLTEKNPARILAY